MKAWIKPALPALAALLIAGCAVKPDRPAVPGEAPALPAEYAAALEQLKSERWDAAERGLQSYAQANPDRAGPQINLALLYRRTDRPEMAAAAIARALEINPQHPAALNQRGILAREAGDFDAARQAYVAAITSDRSYANAELNLAILLDLYQHDPGRAVRHYTRYADLVGEEELDREVASWIADAKRRAEGR